MSVPVAVIPIHENYEGYEPPRYVHPTIDRLLAGVPRQYLSGLQSVVLTNAAAIGKGKLKAAGKTHSRRNCNGFYHRKWKGEPAWIEIVVDNVVGSRAVTAKDRFLEGVVDHILFLQDARFSFVLYHELGHHLDATIGALGAAPELTAEAWARRLVRLYLRKRHRYVVPFVRAARAIWRRVRSLRANVK